MSGYTGTVQARENCTYGGFRYSIRDVFEVQDFCLSPQDPFVPVRVIRQEPHIGGEPAWQPICEVITDLASLNRGDQL